MDAALKLRIAVDNRETIEEQGIISTLESSELMESLTADFKEKPLFAVWRIIALSEIPFAGRLDYTKNVIRYIEKHMVTPDGFTLTGKGSDLLPCYNAMLVEAFSKLGYAESKSVRHAVNWIKNYQPFERNISLTWNGKGVQKYGSCLKSMPCFIGIAKTVKALVAYNKAIQETERQVSELITKGMGYILKHELYQRLSTQTPINHHILDFAFPASYQLNIVELLELAYLTGDIHRSECRNAIKYVNGKKNKRRILENRLYINQMATCRLTGKGGKLNG